MEERAEEAAAVSKRFIRFGDEGDSVLVEVAGEDVEATTGVLKAGLFRRRVEDAVVTARRPLDDALSGAIVQVAKAISTAAGSADLHEGEIELEFAMKVSGEIGNVAIGKIGSEAQFVIRMKVTTA
jgi:hypothetical protein